MDSIRFRGCFSRLAGFGRGEQGAQLVEFAVSLPLLVLFVVGIFDFSNAFTLKQKLTNIARDAARVAARDPANDLQSTSGPPLSVRDAFQDIDLYLLANNLNDCAVANPTVTAPLTWTYTGTTNCPPGGLVITINRGYYFPLTGASLPTSACAPQSPGAQTAVIGTCVSIQYAYQWRFGFVASLVGASGTLPPSITATAVAMNEN
jgi:Flp pilus assembly protein TadG